MILVQRSGCATQDQLGVEGAVCGANFRFGFQAAAAAEDLVALGRSGHRCLMVFEEVVGWEESKRDASG